MSSFRKYRSIQAMATALFAVALLGSGCSDGMQQYVELSEWSQSPDKPVVISGQVARDTAAFKDSMNEISTADWRALEKIAPRPIWEKIARMKGLATDRNNSKNGVNTAQPRPAAPAQRIPVTRLLDGNVRFVYIFRHFGGPNVKATRNPTTKERTITTTPGNIAPLIAILSQNLAKKAVLTSIPGRNGVSVTCSPDVMHDVIAIISDADMAPRQVEISARIFEVSHDFDFQYGAKTVINHIASDGTHGLASLFSAKDFVDAVADPVVGRLTDPGGAMRLMQVMQSAGITLDFTFQALANSGLVKVVAAPRMTVDSGQTASMQAGQEMPIQTAEIERAEVVVTRQLVYKPIGVQLHVTPQATGTESVKLHVLTSLSAISGFSPLPSMDTAFAPGRTLINPIIDSREAITRVTIKDRNTLVIGGMKMIRKVTRESKIPGLGDIAALGWLFKNHHSQKQINDLYFFVTPRLIRNNTPDATPVLYYARDASKNTALAPAVAKPKPAAVKPKPVAVKPKPATTTPVTADWNPGPAATKPMATASN